MFLGLLLSTLLMSLGYLFKYIIPSLVIGQVSLALILGIIIGNVFKVSSNQKIKKGIRFSEKNILEMAIVLMGLKLNLNYLEALGAKTLFFVITSITFTIFISIFIGKIFKLNSKTSLLTGMGNAICGASAITALNPLVKVPTIQMGLIIGVVNFLGTLGIFITPFISNLLDYTALQSSFLIGGTLQAIGHVAAAGFSMGEEIGDTAILIKMFRVLMIAPIVLIYSFYDSSKVSGKMTMPKFPLFIVGFIFSSIVATYFGGNPQISFLLVLSKVLLTTAMAAIGMNISLVDLRKHGSSILYTGSLTFIFQLILAILLIYTLSI